MTGRAPFGGVPVGVGAMSPKGEGESETARKGVPRMTLVCDGEFPGKLVEAGVLAGVAAAVADSVKMGGVTVPVMVTVTVTGAVAVPVMVMV